jgi:hypothetical protein
VGGKRRRKGRRRRRGRTKKKRRKKRKKRITQEAEWAEETRRDLGGFLRGLV